MIARRIRDTIPDADFDDTALVFDAGDRETYRAGFGYSTKPDVVTGFAFSADYQKSELQGYTRIGISTTKRSMMLRSRRR